MVNIAEDVAVGHESSSTGLMAACFVILLALTLTACSGSSSSRSSSGAEDPISRPDDDSPDEQPDEQPEDPPPTPGLSFTASPGSVSPGGNTTLSWTASDAEQCDASGAWSGSRSVSGSQTVGPLEEDAVFRLSCSGDGGGVSREVTVTVNGDEDLTVSLSADPEHVGENDTATLSWSAANAVECSASGGWSGSRSQSGSFETGPLAETTTFSLACRNGSENALASVTVEVLDKMIRWQAPTQNEDGTPLNDLAGYVVYWGTESREYTGSYTIDSPSTTEWEADIAPAMYYFALTAFDSEGNESDYSNELRKRIP